MSNRAMLTTCSAYSQF